jgi:hypothetical protein
MATRFGVVFFLTADGVWNRRRGFLTADGVWKPLPGVAWQIGHVT